MSMIPRHYSFIVLMLATITLSLAATTSAQDSRFRVESVSVGSGESPTTSGLTATIDLGTEKGALIEVNAQQEVAWFLVARAFKLGRMNVVAGGNVAVFQEAPSISPRLYVSVPVTRIAGQQVSVGVLEWPGVFLGRAPRDWRDKPVDGVMATWFTMGQVSVGGFGLTYGYLKFLSEPTNLLPGASYTQAIRKDVLVTGSVTWNGNADRAMYYIGATWVRSP